MTSPTNPALAPPQMAALLHRVADARRDYLDGPVSDGARTVISREAKVLDDVADILTEARRPDELVSRYAPSWRWHQFGEHNPEIRLGLTTPGVPGGQETNDEPGLARCQVCGCTEDTPCPGGCLRVPDPDQLDDLCSACAYTPWGVAH